METFARLCMLSHGEPHFSEHLAATGTQRYKTECKRSDKDRVLESVSFASNCPYWCRWVHEGRRCGSERYEGANAVQSRLSREARFNNVAEKKKWCPYCSTRTRKRFLVCSVLTMRKQCASSNENVRTHCVRCEKASLPI